MSDMRKWGRRVGTALGAIVALLLLVVAGILLTGFARTSKRWTIADEPIQARTDSATLAYGAHVAMTRGCTECHGPNLGGNVLMNGFPMGRLAAPNLTRGRGGAAARFTDADWSRAIRHGVSPEGRSYILMPAFEYSRMGDEDLTALVSYIKSVPPVDTVQPSRKLGPVLQLGVVFGMFPLQARLIDHTRPRPAPPAAGVSVAYGEYLAATCRGCHGQDLTGGAADRPGAPLPPNLNPAGNVGRWSDAQFITTIRTGRTPEGRVLNPDFMPWKAFANHTDDELRAIHMYLRSLPAKTKAAT